MRPGDSLSYSKEKLPYSTAGSLHSEQVKLQIIGRQTDVLELMEQMKVGLLEEVELMSDEMGCQLLPAG